MLGQLAQAEPYYHQALTLYQTIPNTQRSQAACLYNLATTLRALGQPADTEPHYRQALTLYQDIPNTEEQQAACLLALATTLHELGKPADAESYYHQALTLYQTIPGTEREQATCLNNLASSLLTNKELSHTEALYHRAFTLFQTIPGTEYEQATSLYNLACTLLSQGKLDQAESLYQDALNHALPAALFNDEYRYQLTSPTKRRAWITNRAQHSMSEALTIAARLGEAALVAELVAKWRMVGSLATTPAARNSDDPLLTLVPDLTPEPDESLTRTPGPNLVLPHPRTTPLYQHPTIADRPRAHYR